MYNFAMLSALKNADNFMLCTHINPDGDAVGSLLAAGRLLRRMGKRVVLLSQDGVPKALQWLPDAERVKTPEEVAGQRFDAALAVDVPAQSRMGGAGAIFEKCPMRFLIDHHPGDGCGAQHCLIDPKAAATGELITALWEALDMRLDADAAVQLYCALQTDSGNFCFSSVRSYTFACMQKLMEAGLDIAGAANKLFLTKSRAYTAVLAKALSSMRYFAGGQAACMHLTMQDKAACGAQDGDLHGIVNYALYQEGIRMCFMADESERGWRISLRALPGGNAAQIAEGFGGGGHTLAAGCVMEGSYAAVERALITAIEEVLLK